MRKIDLTGKIAIVTGASRGIGRHIAAALHEAGAKVAVTGRNLNTLEAAARAIGERCKPFPCDQRNPDVIASMANRVASELGSLDILVANAGVYRSAPVTEMSLDFWNDIVETNLTGTFLTVQAFLPGMIAKNRGDVFLIGSMSGKKGDAGTSAYNASKFGLQGFAQALTYEVRKHNIRVMILNPSTVNTGADDGPEFGKSLHLHAADIASTIVHLATLPGRTLIRDMDIWGTNP
jgi:3-oxoacyl-[acyl-carrier protein] reductase